MKAQKRYIESGSPSSADKAVRRITQRLAVGATTGAALIATALGIQRFEARSSTITPAVKSTAASANTGSTSVVLPSGAVSSSTSGSSSTGGSSSNSSSLTSTSQPAVAQSGGS